MHRTLVPDVSGRGEADFSLRGHGNTKGNVLYVLFIGNKNYSSWSLRPWLLLTTLGIPFEERLMPFEDGGSREKFREFSPTGLVPCLHDGEIVVWESLGIVEHIAEAYPGVWPAGPAERAWARSAAAEMHAGFGSLRNECPMTVGMRVRLHSISSGLEADLARLAEVWQEGLERFGGSFLAGSEFTAVDAFYAPMAFRLQTYGLDLPGEAVNYARRILELPAMAAWTREALAEPFREADHEREMTELGECLEDLRH